MKKNKHNLHNPHFSVEIKINDEKGRKIFHWKPGQNNLVLGMKKTNEFIECKLGIDKQHTKPDDIVEEYWLNEKKRKDINKFIKESFGMEK